MKLNPEQRKAVEHKEGPLLVLAGAGSGKTRVVTARIAHLVESGVDPSRLIGVTFTNKAADEMRERVRRMANAEVLICTFHSLGVRILRESIHHLGYRPYFAIYDEDDSLKLLKECLQGLEVRDRNVSDKSVRALISQMKNELKGPKELDETVLRQYPEFQGIYERYQERLKSYNAVDFDDLLLLPVKLMEEHVEIREFYQRRWNYVLIDEYQDTNAAQYRLARLLTERTGNVFAVGDPDQSIYSWRGADVGNILSFEEDFPGANVVRLEQNYRSTTTILDAANALINYNHDRYQKNLWSDLGRGEKLKLFTADTERDEAEFVVREVLRLHAKEGVPLREMAVFYRTNAQSRILEDTFLYASIPYVVLGGLSFYQRREIKDAVAFLRLMESGDDFIAFSRIVNVPKRGIGAVALEKLRGGAEEAGLGILDFCQAVVEGQANVKLSAKQREGLHQLVSIFVELRSLKANMDLPLLIKALLERSGYLNYLKEEPDTYDDRRENLEQLEKKAQEWEERTGNQALGNFLEDLSLRSSVDDTDLTQDRVAFMTVHNSKGLEYDTVFLVGMEEELFPHANARASRQAQEEERRLCYVGMTRAKRRLFLSHALSRYAWVGKHMVRRPSRASRFLKEIPSLYFGLEEGSEEEESVYEYEPEYVEAPVGAFAKNAVVFHPEYGIGMVMEAREEGSRVIYRVFFQNLQEVRELDSRTSPLTLL